MPPKATNKPVADSQSTISDHEEELHDDTLDSELDEQDDYDDADEFDDFDDDQPDDENVDGETMNDEDLDVQRQHGGRTQQPTDHSAEPRPVSDAASEEQAEDEPSELGELAGGVEVALTFEVGRTQISLERLRSLSGGYTFELETPIKSPVLVKAYGQLIGRGELVQIDDRLGVRLLEINRNGC